MNKHEDKKDGRENILLRFSVGLGVLALMLALTAGSCDKKKAGNNPPKMPPAEPGPTVQDCAKEGFTVTFENDDHKKAFSFGKFDKDATNGSFDADLSVKLSKLTNANGFVSNHVWINPDEEKFAMPFEEVGVLAGTTANATGGGAFTAGARPFDGYDFKFCGFEKLATGSTDYVAAAATPEADDYWEGFDPAKLTGSIDFHNEYNVAAKKSLWDGDTDAASNCLDGFRYGDVLQPVVANPVKKGKLKVGYNIPAGTATTLFDAAKLLPHADNKLWDEEYETSMDKTGAYYVRDSMAYKYVKKGATTAPTHETTGTTKTGAVPFVTNVKHVQKNDTDLFYDEVLRVFKAGGAAMAGLTAVFDPAMNMGISTTFTRQPAAVDADNSGNPFASPWAEAAGELPAGGVLGTSVNGGWQKLFTITPCDTKTIKNGIAIAYGHAGKTAADKWEKEPTLSFDGATIFTDDITRKVIVRKGTKAAVTGTNADAGNEHALLFESVVSPKYKGATDLGFFTIQHAAPVALTVAKNAFTTKGVIHCRSALAIADDAATTANTGKQLASDIMAATKSKTDIAGYKNKLQGYKDGAISDKVKGVGLTCYLGLSALWPEAIDGAPKVKDATGVHGVQFANANKTTADQYDFSDKYLGLLMINMPEDVTVGDKALAPIFNQFSTDADATNTGATKTIDASKDKAKSILKDIKAADSFGYLHGNVKVSFSKD